MMVVLILVQGRLLGGDDSLRVRAIGVGACRLGILIELIFRSIAFNDVELDNFHDFSWDLWDNSLLLVDLTQDCSVPR